MKTSRWMMRVAQVALATLMACANRLLKNRRMPDDRKIIAWIFLIVVIVTDCTPY